MTFLALSVEKISVVLPHCLKVNFLIVQEAEGLDSGVMSCITQSHDCHPPSLSAGTMSGLVSSLEKQILEISKQQPLSIANK